MTHPLEMLRDRFRDRAAADRGTLEVLAEGDLKSGELRRLIHNLSGTAGIFGFGALSQAAAEIDDQMAAGMPVDPTSLERL